MDLAKRISLARAQLHDSPDHASKQRWSNAELTDYATDADREIARRAECLTDSDTIGYFSLSGVAGQVDSVVVSGVTITTGAVAFNTSLAMTTEDVADNITAKTIVAGTPAYRAVARDRYVIIKAVPNTGYPAAGYTVVVNASGGLTATITRLRGFCRHILAADQRFLPIHPKILKITRFKPSSQANPVGLTNKEDMDSSVSDWEVVESSTAITAAIPDYKTREIIVYPPRDATELIEQDCRRLPLYDFDSSQTWETGELPEGLHQAAVSWMLRQAYLKSDSETYDPERSAVWDADCMRQIEDWKFEQARRMHGSRTATLPSGVL